MQLRGYSFHHEITPKLFSSLIEIKLLSRIFEVAFHFPDHSLFIGLFLFFVSM